MVIKKCVSSEKSKLQIVKAMVAGLIVFVFIIALLAWLGSWYIICMAIVSTQFDDDEDDNHGYPSMRCLQDENDEENTRAVQTSENPEIHGHQEHPGINY